MKAYTVPDAPQIVDETANTNVIRCEVMLKTDEPDPKAHTALALLASTPAFDGKIKAVHSYRVFLVESTLSRHQVEHVVDTLIADPICETWQIHAEKTQVEAIDAITIEVHYKPGVMDPVAQSTEDAICDLFQDKSRPSILTGVGYKIERNEDAEIDLDILNSFFEKNLANTVVQDVYPHQHFPQSFEHGSNYVFGKRQVNIRSLDDDALLKLAKDGHLFLNLEEMKTLQKYFVDLDREATDIELESIAQTWSEHCVHKTLKSKVHYVPDHTPVSNAPFSFEARPGHEIQEDGSVVIDNLLKSTVAAATFELMKEAPHNEWCISVFEDNAGIVGFDEEDGICIKVETHNHPSAIEPYGGSATGIGGCIRDIMGTGLVAKPVANTDVFCVAEPDTDASTMPKGIIHPKRILQQVVSGVRDYGNRMGIPTVNGAVWFDEDYLGNPLVYCGCIGLIPRDKCFGTAQPGDRIIALGGRTGRDGIHGATFSSDELTDTHADEFSHAVQIGNAITQKKVLDVLLKARDQSDVPLFTAVTDCGAGGFSSAIGEMGEKVGAYVELEQAPLKYPGLSYTEIWISEAQERMVLSVPEEKLDELQALCDTEDVELANLGYFGVTDENGEAMLKLSYKVEDERHEVGELKMGFLHDGLPDPTRKAAWSASPRQIAGLSQKYTPVEPVTTGEEMKATLLALLSHPNIASKHWVIRQYDHEVQGGSVIKPLMGVQNDGPSDSSVIRPKLDSDRGFAISCGLQTGLGEKFRDRGLSLDGDSYLMVLAAIDEAMRNLVCTGADPRRVAILDNFCWAKCDDPYQLGSLVRAAEACYDGALAYKTPFVSGKDSLSNQFTTEDGRLITIPPTLLISALGIVDDVNKCISMDAKQTGSRLFVIGETKDQLGGSHYCLVKDGPLNARDMHVPRVDMKQGYSRALISSDLIQKGLVSSMHDCSEGGVLLAAAEMAMAGRLGLNLDLSKLPYESTLSFAADVAAFSETPSRYLIEVNTNNYDAFIKSLAAQQIPFAEIGSFKENLTLTVSTQQQGELFNASIEELVKAWREPLDWR